MKIQFDENDRPSEIELTRPDDWHLHLRDNAGMWDILRHTTRVFGRAIVMPNLKPPVTTVTMAKGYREDILRFIERQGVGEGFQPLMTLYLTDNTSAEEIRLAKESGFIHGVKLYPAGATTNSDAGVTDIRHCRAALETMQREDLPLLIHGEVTRDKVDIFDREACFIDEGLIPLRRDFPGLRVVLEHVTTRQAVQYVAEAEGRIAATITAHHLVYNRNAIFLTPDGRTGVRPHNYCLPVLKREVHREWLVAAATSGDPKFFLGTDSAPHAKHLKENACGCAGCFTAPVAQSLYAEAFESAGKLEKLEGFASHFGPDFYGLPRNRDTIKLVRKPWTVPESYSFGDGVVVPLCAGETLEWQVVGN